MPKHAEPGRIPYKFSHQAMATVFEVITHHKDPDYAGQAAAAAFAELDTIETELSRFNESSDISKLNSLPAGKTLTLSMHAFECLNTASEVSTETGGAFDVTLGSGHRALYLDPVRHTANLGVAPVSIDLGGIGKGYAADRMLDILKEWEIDSAIVQGGRSSVCASGAPGGSRGWKLSVTNPFRESGCRSHIFLSNSAMGASGLEKGFHVIDPRDCKPVRSRRAVWIIASTGARADALSTAFMIMTKETIALYCAEHPDVSALLVTNSNYKRRFGKWESYEEAQPNVDFI